MSSNRFNYTKWGFVVAVISAGIAVVSIPEIGCKFGLSYSSCVSPLKDVELIVQDENGISLSNVKVSVIAKGAPESQYTDQNGYIKIRVPSEGTVRVGFLADGLPAQELAININNVQAGTRIIRLTESGEPVAERGRAAGVTTRPQSNPDVPVQRSSYKELVAELERCKRSSETVICDFVVTDMQENRRLKIYTRYNNRSSRAIDPNGAQYGIKTVSFGDERSQYSAQQNLVKGIKLRGSLSLEGVTAEIQEFSLLEMEAQSGENFRFQFQEVPIVE